ncbi:MAG: hypothetical protein K2M17_00465 [Bacilli bacterium]|nr:hypothetical protein [Bacilli bacterium]
MKKISYYDLLGLLKQKKYPLKVKLHMCGRTAIYRYFEEDECYIIENQEKIGDIFGFCLNDCLTDRDCLEDLIEIVGNVK